MEIDETLLSNIKSLLREFSGECEQKFSEIETGIVTEFIAWLELKKLNKNKKKVRKAIFMKQDGNLGINFYEDDGTLRHLVAVPPGIEERTDIYSKDNYTYNFKGSVKKLRGKFIVIKVKDNKIQELKYIEH